MCAMFPGQTNSIVAAKYPQNFVLQGCSYYIWLITEKQTKGLQFWLQNETYNDIQDILNQELKNELDKILSEKKKFLINLMNHLFQSKVAKALVLLKHTYNLKKNK